MSEAAQSRAQGPTLGFIVGLLAVMAALAAVDLFLARVERFELRAEAEHFFQQGTRLLRDGRNAEAVDALRRANSLVRGASRYQLQLAAAMIASQDHALAEQILRALLQREPNNGRANLLMARVSIERGRTRDAQSYYHRAIYGSWSEEEEVDARRIEARLELVNFLASNGSQKDLLAELLPLESEAPSDPAVRKRIAGLYTQAGSPARAVAAYRALLQDSPGDGETYAGIGEAELARGNYYSAQNAFAAALRRGYDNEAVRRQQDLARRLASLDPTPRGLSAKERADRSDRILQMAMNSLDRCSSKDARSPEIAEVLAEAESTLSRRSRRAPTNEDAEAGLALADKIWRLKTAACPRSARSDDEAVRLILEKLAQ